MSKKIILALYNMGGPSSVDDVERFLTALFTDPDLLDLPMGPLLQNFVANKIITKRLDEVKARYAQLGGKSPQLGITQNLADALKAQLRRERLSHSVVDVTPLMRYCEPSANTVLERAVREGAEEIWLYPQYPQCARPTTGTSLRELALLRARSESSRKVTVRSFANYFDHPRFLDLWEKRLRRAWESLASARRHILVSAHNLPLSYVAEGDPYPNQIYRTAREVMRRLGLVEGVHWSLAWQSAVGPVKWMHPYTDAELVRLGRERVESVLMWPVAFVSDHIETLHEIDIEYAELAHSVGIKDYRRVPNLNADSDFVEFLAHTIIQGDRDLSQYGFSSVVRDLETHPSGEGCHRQAGGCLCGRYFTSGSEGLERGVVPSRMSASQVPLEVRERAYSSSPQTSQATPSQDVRESHAHRL